MMITMRRNCGGLGSQASGLASLPFPAPRIQIKSKSKSKSRSRLAKLNDNVTSFSCPSSLPSLPSLPSTQADILSSKVNLLLAFDQCVYARHKDMLTVLQIKRARYVAPADALDISTPCRRFVSYLMSYQRDDPSQPCAPASILNDMYDAASFQPRIFPSIEQYRNVSMDMSYHSRLHHHSHYITPVSHIWAGHEVKWSCRQILAIYHLPKYNSGDSVGNLEQGRLPNAILG